MKIMLVSESARLRPLLEKLFLIQNADVIHYENPIKAMDNLEEIDPEIVIFAAMDFPRHWKPFVIYLRNTYSRREAVFILLTSESFPEDESNKADYLEVNAVISQTSDNETTIQKIKGIITRYYQSVDIRGSARYAPSPDDRISFCFTNPYTFRIVTGNVLDISAGGLLFEPHDSEQSDQLDTWATITAATLRLGDNLFAVKARAVRVSETLALEYLDLTIEDEKAIIDFLKSTAVAQ